MEYIYPATFSENSDGSYTILFPDLPGCISEGKSLAKALYMAQDALTGWIECAIEDSSTIAPPSYVSTVKAPAKGFVNLVRADIRDNRAIRRTVSVPSWLDAKASDAGISLSKVLQEALKERLEV